MAGYSKGIVDTRKLNKDSKAKLGRRGDTKIREVDNKESHVNALEAYLIDVNGKAGEEYAKRVGAGTVNPLTGMPEYHQRRTNHGNEHTHGTMEQTTRSGTSTVPDYSVEIPTTSPDPNAYIPPTGRQDYETLAGMEEGQLEDYLQGEFDIGEDSMKYIEGFDEKPFEFIEKDYANIQAKGQLGLDKLDIQRDTLNLGEEKLGSDLDYQQRQLGSTKGFAMEGLQNRFMDTSQALGRQYRAGVKGALGQSQATQSRSGFASSGAAQYGMQSQLKELTKGKTEGMDVARRDLGFGQRQAQSAYDFGMEGSQSAYDFAMKGIGLDRRGLAADYAGLRIDKRQATTDYDRSIYGEERRQLDQLYADVTTIPS